MSNNSEYRDIISLITVNQEETNRNSVLMKRADVMRTMGQHLAKIYTGAYVQINTLKDGSVVFDMNSCYTAAEHSRA